MTEQLYNVDLMYVQPRQERMIQFTLGFLVQ